MEVLRNMKTLMNKKGLLGLNQLIGIIMLLVVVGIMLVVGVTINEGVESSLDATNTEGVDAARNATRGLANVSEQQGLLGTIIIFGVVISVVIVAFMVRT